MKHRSSVFLTLGLLLLWQGQTPSLAAKKYYPPGFTPPSDQKLIPSKTPAPEPTPQVIIQQLPGSKQVIIKTVPVTRPTKPKDPLLVLIEEHRYYDALRVLDTRLSKSPNSVYLQMMRGQILREEGNYQQALAQYQSIFEKNKTKNTKAGALNGLGWTHLQKAFHNKRAGNIAGFEAELSSADASFRQATRLQPNLSYAWAGLSQVALANDQLKEAEEWIKKAKRFSPNILTVQLTEAKLLLARKKPEEALQILYGIKKTTTHEPEVFLMLAQASLDTGKVDDAIINLKQMLGITPDDPEGLKLLSQSYELKMKPEDAAQVLERAISLNPADTTSVEALIKLYDQRDQTTRSELLLKTLLKDNPSQVHYGKLLLERLIADCRWEEAYREGLSFVGPTLTNKDESEAAQQTIVNLFAQAVFQQGRGMLDWREAMQEPAVQQARRFSQEQLEKSVANGESDKTYDLNNRLNLLLIDPLALIPALPKNFTPTPEQLPATLQIAVLQGDGDARERLLQQAQSGEQQLALAKALYNLGDYNGAVQLADSAIAASPENAEEAKGIRQNAEHAQQAMKDQLITLSRLPRRVSDEHWKKVATEALRVGSGNWETHAQVSDGLEKRNQLPLALLHQRLTAQYATHPRDKKQWAHKAEKTAKKLEKEKQKEEQGTAQGNIFLNFVHLLPF